MSRNTTANVISVRMMANLGDVHCEPTMSSLTSMAVRHAGQFFRRFPVSALEGGRLFVHRIHALAVSATGMNGMST